MWFEKDPGDILQTCEGGMESQSVQDLWEFPQRESHLEPKPKRKDFLSCFSLWRDPQSPLPASLPPAPPPFSPFRIVCIKQPSPALPCKVSQ